MRFIKYNMPRYVYLTIRSQALVAFMVVSIAKKNAWLRFEVKFVRVIGSKVGVVDASTDFEGVIIRFLVK